MGAAERIFVLTLRGEDGFCLLTLRGEDGFCLLTLRGEDGFCLLTLRGEDGFCRLTLRGEDGFCLLTLRGESDFCLLTLLGEDGFCLLLLRGEEGFCLLTLRDEDGFCLLTWRGESDFCLLTLLVEDGFCLLLLRGEDGFCLLTLRVALFEVAAPPMPTWGELQARVRKPLVAPQWVVRPAPIELSRADAGLLDLHNGQSKPAIMCGLVLLSVFKLLSVNDLLVVMRVCREWARWSVHPSLWPHLTLPPNRPVRPDQMEGIVRRQPNKLTLSWTQLTQAQLKWLLMRLPQLSELELEGLTWGEVREIATCYCPPLSKLNLNFVQGFNDDTLALMLAPPVSKRPGFRNQQCSRLSNLTHLSLSNSLVTNTGITAICSELRLVHLDVSNCIMVTEDTIKIIVDGVGNTLESLDVRSCQNLKVFCLPELAKLKLLSWLGMDNCPNVPIGALQAWSQTHGYTEVKKGVYTRIPPTVKKVSRAIQSRLVKSAFQEILKTHIQKLSNKSRMIPSSEKKADSGSARPKEHSKDNGTKHCDSSVGEGKDMASEIDDELNSKLSTEVTKKADDARVDYADETGKASAVEAQENQAVECGKNNSTLESKPTVGERSTCGQSKELISKEATATKDEDCADSVPVNDKQEPKGDKSFRCRKRPSRFADSEVDTSPSFKNSRKNLKLVTVELEDIGSATKLGCKMQNVAKDSSKKDEFPSKPSLISPKSKWLAQADPSSKKVDKNFSSDEAESLPAASPDLPRRHHRRLREVQEGRRESDVQEGHRERTSPKDSSPSSVKGEDTSKTEISGKRLSVSDETPEKKTAQCSPKKKHKKEKDIITRSKRLKQEPALESNLEEKYSAVTEASNLGKDYASKSHIESRSHSDKFELKHKASKRERSSSFESTGYKHETSDKPVTNLDSKYSAKLRKKSHEGSPLVDNANSDTGNKPLKEQTKQRRRPSKDEDKAEVPRLSLDHEEPCKPSSASPSARSSRRRSDEASKEKKNVDLKVTKEKKISSAVAEESDKLASTVATPEVDHTKGSHTEASSVSAKNVRYEKLKSPKPASPSKSFTRDKVPVISKKKGEEKPGSSEKKREILSGMSTSSGSKAVRKNIIFEKTMNKFGADPLMRNPSSPDAAVSDAPSAMSACASLQHEESRESSKVPSSALMGKIPEISTEPKKLAVKRKKFPGSRVVDDNRSPKEKPATKPSKSVHLSSDRSLESPPIDKKALSGRKDYTKHFAVRLSSTIQKKSTASEFSYKKGKSPKQGTTPALDLDVEAKPKLEMPGQNRPQVSGERSGNDKIFSCVKKVESMTNILDHGAQSDVQDIVGASQNSEAVSPVRSGTGSRAAGKLEEKREGRGKNEELEDTNPAGGSARPDHNPTTASHDEPRTSNDSFLGGRDSCSKYPT
ncbi:hypothetical protein HAZT_HAZT008488 [Hyalella azteca]|uniref:F-box domain-containing protein n=1 Tax=Hyalella azteca TaxID=294128 RepID=A0A6A0GZV1_HYAAZ|nr:hypothetical protein HAZT_HAZT008488 [Hyalella azteca]